jgi:hypothetical protein
LKLCRPVRGSFIASETLKLQLRNLRQIFQEQGDARGKISCARLVITRSNSRNVIISTLPPPCPCATDPPPNAMPLMAVASQPFLSTSTSTSSRHIRRATVATAAAAAPDDFDYPLADPSVRWPHLRFPHLPSPRFPAAPVARPSEGGEEEEAAAGPSSAAASAASASASALLLTSLRRRKGRPAAWLRQSN